MIFPNLQLEPVVQLKDRTRLDADKSFVTPEHGDIINVMIRPSASADFISVGTEEKWLDWAYAASGTYQVTARVVAASGGSADFTSDISVITAAQDNLFSSDADLKTHESDIMKWVEPGRNSYLNIHRRAQKLIMDELRREGFVDVNDVPFTKAAIVDIEEVREWSTMWALQLIFEGRSNAIDDIFHEKSVYYSALRLAWGKTIYLRLDTDGSGTAETGEGIDTEFAVVARR